MAEQPSPDAPKTVSYGSNSRNKPAKTEKERPTPTKIITGDAIEKRKGIGSKLKDQFTGDDARTVGQYLLLDVVVPAVKNLIYDLGMEGLKRSLFGSTMGPRPTGGIVSQLAGGMNRGTSYSAYSRPAQAGPPQQLPSAMTPQQRAMHDFSNVILGSREEGLMVIDHLSNLIDDFGTATVNDFYALIGQSSDFTSVKYGWKSLSSAEVRHIREGYLLVMPKPILLES